MIKSKTISKLVRGLLIILPIVAAVLVLVYLAANRSAPTRKEAVEYVRTLRIIEAPTVNLIPRVVGYGVAEPGSIWEAVAEVRGTVISVHPRLRSGEIVAGETVLLQLDPAEYELAMARLEASVEETRAKLKELDGEEENTRRLLAIEQRSLDLAKTSFDRKLEALKRKAISQDEADREEKNFVQQKQSLQRLENTLALIPSRRQALNSALAVHQANLEQARIDLSKTKISAPFDCRLGEVRLESGQFVRAGQLLFQTHGIAATEIEARFRVEELLHLLNVQKRPQFQPGLSSGSFQEIFDDIRVLISLKTGDWSAEWEARIDRVREALDVKTREIRIVASVERPYEKAVPGVRPPLTPGMFCRVELQAPVRKGSVVVPRSAIHDHHVFIIDQEERLQQKSVMVDFVQAEFVVIRSGLSGGERVVVSDPTPAIIGMRVSGVVDEGLRQELIALSEGGKGK